MKDKEPISAYAELAGGVSAFGGLGRNFGRLGASFGVLGTASSSHPTTVLVLTWTSTSSSAAPTFTVDGDLAAGDVLTYQTAVSGTSFASPTNTTHTISSGEDTANEATGVLPTLANGTYDARVTSTRGGFAFGTSNVVTFTISVVSGNHRISSAGNNRIGSAGNNRIQAA